LFLQNHYFFEKQLIFSAFFRKIRLFFQQHPDFFSNFPKNTPLFTPLAEKQRILISLKIEVFKNNFQP